MNILLISPNTLTVPYPVYPIGLDYVAGSVSAEHQVRIVDLNVTSLDELAKILAHFKPEFIGISCRNIDNTEAGDPLFFISEYRKLVQWLRGQTDARIVCGGSGFTIMPQQVMAALDADFGIIGEGERFGLLVDVLAKGGDPMTIPGVMTPTEPGSTPAPWNGDRVRGLQNDCDHAEFYIDKGGMLNLQSKRGCSFGCIYCPYPSIEGKKHRLIAPNEVAETALGLEKAGAKYFFITDSAFNSDVEHSLAVAKAFKKASVSIPWGAFFAPRKLAPDYFTIMKEAGLKHVEFGTESLSPAMLQTYRKPFKMNDVFKTHEQALAAGLHTAHYFLLGGPGESAETVQETLRNIEKLQKTVLFFFIGIRIYPQTPLYAMALQEGKINSQTDLLQPVFYKSDNIDRVAIEKLVETKANGRLNWIIGSGGKKSAAIVDKMHQRGYSGPLWEYLIRS